MRSWTIAPTLLALAACGRSDAAAEGPAAARSIAFSAEEVEQLEARIDRDPEQAVLLLEQAVAGSVASLTDAQFDELRDSLLDLQAEGRLRKLVRAGREMPATSAQVARLLDELEAWDAAILRGADHLDLGYDER